MVNDEKKSLILRSSYYYFVKGMRITEIAELMNISRFRVSRYIDEARTKNYIVFHITDPAMDYERLGIELEEKLDLNHVKVVPVNEKANREEIRKFIGLQSTSLLAETSKNLNISITWGRTIAYFAEAIPDGEYTAKNVIELAGSIGNIAESISAHSVANNVAEKLQANLIKMTAPIIVDNKETTKSLINESSIKQAVNAARESDIAIVGVGPVKDNDTSLNRSGYIDEEDLAQLAECGAVGSLLGRFFDKDGDECETSFKDRVIAIQLKDFEKIPRRILLAGGEHKVDAILALARNNKISELVTDSNTAESLLKMLNREK